MIDRRKFLGRSVLSAGSVIFSSALLQSCTKYGLPLPGRNPHPPIIFPPLIGDEADNWNNTAKLTVTTALQLVPDVGGFASALIDIVWPSSGNSPWDQVRTQVEALINQKLADDDYNRVTGNLAGLRSVIKDYKKKSTSTLISKRIGEMHILILIYINLISNNQGTKCYCCPYSLSLPTCTWVYYAMRYTMAKTGV